MLSDSFFHPLNDNINCLISYHFFFFKKDLFLLKGTGQDIILYKESLTIIRFMTLIH